VTSSLALVRGVWLMRGERNLLTGAGFLTLAVQSAKILCAGQLPGDMSELWGAGHAPKGKRSERRGRVSR